MKRIVVTMASATLLAAAPAWSIDLAPGLTLKGFGTVGLASSNNSQADFTTSPISQPSGAGRSEDVSPNVDSKLGLQFDWKALSRLGFAAQLLSRQSQDGNYEPQIAWAYGKFAATQDLDLRVGRLRAPIYMLSDYLDVNFANPWVRPPVEFYAAVPVSKMDGVDLLWHPSFGEVATLIQPYFGRSLNRNAGHATATEDAFLGFNATATYGSWTLRAGYNHASFSINIPAIDTQVLPLIAGFCHLGDPGACSAIPGLEIQNTPASFKSLGFIYDDGDNLVSGEVGRSSVAGAIPIGTETSWYLTAGRHLGKWMPYLTYSVYRNDNPDSYNAGLFPPTNFILDAVLASAAMNQHTVTVGTRYELDTNLALKAQLDTVQTALKDGIPGTGAGLFTNATPAFASGANRVEVLSLSLDFVF